MIVRIQLLLKSHYPVDPVKKLTVSLISLIYISVCRSYHHKENPSYFQLLKSPANLAFYFIIFIMVTKEEGINVHVFSLYYKIRVYMSSLRCLNFFSSLLFQLVSCLLTRHRLNSMYYTLKNVHCAKTLGSGCRF